MKTLLSNKMVMAVMVGTLVAVSLTAGGVVAGPPMASVSSKDGTCTLESSKLSSSQTTYAASAYSIGSHTVTPVLGGDANSAANTNTALTQTLKYGSQTFGWKYCNAICFQTDDPSAADKVFQRLGTIGSYYLIGPWYSSALFWETVMYFDIDQYIAGKTIQSAELQLQPLDLPADFGTTYAVSPLAWGWNPATVTWNNCPDRYTSPKSVANPPYSTTTLWNIDITAIVQAWASGSIDNNGVIIYDDQVAWPQVSLIRWFRLYDAQLYIACDAPIQYDLGISSTAGGFVATPGEGIYTYDEGTVVHLVAEAQDEYHFTNWAGNVGTIADVNAASTTITMMNDYSITANFAGQPDTYYLTVGSTAGGHVVTGSGEGTFACVPGAVLHLEAEPDEGYRFVEWTGDVDTIADVNAASTTITMMNDYSITANFAGQPDTYYLTVASTSGGDVTGRGEGTFACVPGAVLHLETEPDEGYRFVEWTGDVGTIADVDDASTTITMMNDYSITANFERVRDTIYDLTVASTAGGHVAGSGEGTFACLSGAVLHLQAEPDEGYRFVEWTGDVGTIADVNDAGTFITMTNDCSVTANFERLRDTYYLNVASTTGGAVIVPGEGTSTYDEGTVVDLVAEPEEGYRFVEWTGDVSTIVDVSAAQAVVTMADHYAITAKFIKQYNLSINSMAGGRVLNPGEGTFTYDEGEAVELSVTGDGYYRFDKWTGDVDTIANVEEAYTRIYMMGDYSITANFRLPARVNWSLIGGIIAAVVAVGLGIFFVRRKRVASAKGG